MIPIERRVILRRSWRRDMGCVSQRFATNEIPSSGRLRFGREEGKANNLRECDSGVGLFRVVAKAKNIRKVNAVMNTQVIENRAMVTLYGFIYQGFGAYASEYMQQLKDAGMGIDLFIHSGGGHLMEACHFYDYCKLKNIEFNAYIIGDCASAATIFALAAGVENCEISENSDYLIHRVHYQDEFGNSVAGPPGEADRQNAKMEKVYIAATGISKKELRKLMDSGDKGVAMSAKDAVANGFAKKIMKPATVQAHNKVAAIAGFDFDKSKKKKTKMAKKKKTAKMFKFTKAVKVPVKAALNSITGDPVELEIEMTEEELKNINPEIEIPEGQSVEEATEAALASQKKKFKAKMKKVANAYDKAIGDKDQALADKDKEIKELRAQLKKPLAKRTVPKASRAATGGDQSNDRSNREKKADKALAKFLKNNTTSLDRVISERNSQEIEEGEE